jgi:hypothetical protein
MLQVVVAEPLPGSGVDAGCTRDHAVQVEEESHKFAEVDVLRRHHHPCTRKTIKGSWRRESPAVSYPLRILTKYAASATLYLRPSSADFITITAESDFRYRQDQQVDCPQLPPP